MGRGDPTGREDGAGQPEWWRTIPNASSPAVEEMPAATNEPQVTTYPWDSGLPDRGDGDPTLTGSSQVSHPPDSGRRATMGASTEEAP